MFPSKPDNGTPRFSRASIFAFFSDIVKEEAIARFKLASIGS